MLGYEKGVKVKKGETAPKNVLNIFSIGKGETTWTEEPDGPEGGGSAYGVELNGKLYFVVDHRYMAIFDTVSKTWDTTKAPHSPRSPSVGHYKGEIWVMGGRSSEGGSVTYIYNPTSKDWRKGPDLPSPTMWGCAFTIDGKLYVPGGAGPKHGHMVFHSRTLRLREK